LIFTVMDSVMAFTSGRGYRRSLKIAKMRAEVEEVVHMVLIHVTRPRNC